MCKNLLWSNYQEINRSYMRPMLTIINEVISNFIAAYFAKMIIKNNLKSLYTIKKIMGT